MMNSRSELEPTYITSQKISKGNIGEASFNFFKRIIIERKIMKILKTEKPGKRYSKMILNIVAVTVFVFLTIFCNVMCAGCSFKTIF